MNEKREKRLNSEMQKLIYEILTVKVKNHHITEMFSISAVEVSKELDVATAYVSIFSTDDKKKELTFNAIVDSKGIVRRELAKMMRLKFVPSIQFKLDNSSEYGEKIEKIIASFTYGDQNDEK